MKIGDIVRPRDHMLIGSYAVRPKDRGRITAAGAGTNWEVKWPGVLDLGALVSVVREEDLVVVQPSPEPEPEPDHAEGFVQAALDHMENTVGPTAKPSQAMRSIMIADVYARLEQAAATDRQTEMFREVLNARGASHRDR